MPMTNIDLQQLQNGADIRGVALEGVIGENVVLTPEVVMALCRGFVAWLRQKHGNRKLRIALGIDCRLTGPHFMEAAEQSLAACGCEVLDCGLASTPAMLQSTVLEEVAADGAVMFTGSHLTFNRNGMKFFASGNDLTSKQTSEVLQLAQYEEKTKCECGEVHIFNLLALYSQLLRSKIESDLLGLGKGSRPLEGLKIVVDAGNGAGAFFATRVLRPLGADVSESQFLNPDGRFPNHMPNPEDYEAMRSIATAVKISKADMGILFDADVDRVAIVDSEGRALNRNKLVALASALVLEEHPATTIVTDSITSEGLGLFITQTLSGKHCRYQRGYRNVIAEAERLNTQGEECWLAVETSGHAAFRENNFNDDGAYFATKLVTKLAQLKAEGRQLFSLIEKLPVPADSRELRLPIIDSDFSRAAAETMAGLRQYVSQIVGWEEVGRNYEGLRVICNNPDEKGWFMCRLSLHDPVMPINIESEMEGGTQVIVQKLKLYFRNVRSVDSRALYS